MKFVGIALSEDAAYDNSLIKDAVEEMDGTLITEGSDSRDEVIGEVTDAEYIEGEGVHYTATIMDERISGLIEKDLVDIAPRLHVDCDDDGNTTEIIFNRLFVTANATDDVPGVIDRKT